jgi:hypothetical protein
VVRIIVGCPPLAPSAVSKHAPILWREVAVVYVACMTNSMGQTDRELEEDEENGATAKLRLVA